MRLLGLLMCVGLSQLALAAPLAGQQRSSLLTAARPKPVEALPSHRRLEFSEEPPPFPRGVKIVLFVVGGSAVGAITAANIVRHNRRPSDGCVVCPVYEGITIGLGALVGALIGGGIGATIFRPEPASARQR